MTLHRPSRLDSRSDVNSSATPDQAHPDGGDRGDRTPDATVRSFFDVALRALKDGALGLTTTQRIVLMAVAIRSAGTEGHCWEHQETMAEGIGVTARAMRSALRVLKRRGLVVELHHREARALLGYPVRSKMYTVSASWAASPLESRGEAGNGCPERGSTPPGTRFRSTTPLRKKPVT